MERKLFFLNAFQFYSGILRDFKVRVCETCDWSDSTFYRKIKNGAPLSNAEREAVVGVCKELAEKAKLLVKDQK